MIPVSHFSGADSRNRVVAVLGLGPRGLAAARSLAQGGARPLAWDDRAEARARAEAAGVETADLAARDWSDVDALVVTPTGRQAGRRIAELAALTRTPIVNDVELFARALEARPENARGRVVAVSGARGKSTTAALIAHVLTGSGRDAQLSGDLGAPVLALAAPHSGAIYVLDLDAQDWALAPSLKPRVAVLLNADDAERAIAGGGEAVARLLNPQTGADHAVVGVDDAAGRVLAAELAARDDGPALTPVSTARALARGVHAVGGVLFDALDGSAHAALDLRRVGAFVGRHHWLHAAAAYAACRLLGLESARVAGEIARYAGAAHRLEHVGTRGAARFFDDSMATDPGAARQGLATFENIYWIAGGGLADGSLASLSTLMPRVAKAYLIGESAETFAAALKGRVVAAICRDLTTAVARAAADAETAKRADPVVLLSPACPAGEQFADAAARGAAFRQIVESLPGVAISGAAA